MGDKSIIHTIPTNCPNCGAVIDIRAYKCAYCDTPYTFTKTSDEAITVKLYTDNAVMCAIQMDMNRKLINSIKTQRGIF